MEAYTGLDLSIFYNIDENTVFLIIPENKEDVMEARKLQIEKGRNIIAYYPKEEKVRLLFIDKEHNDIYTDIVERRYGVYSICDALLNFYRYIFCDEEWWHFSDFFHDEYYSKVIIHDKSYVVYDSESAFFSFGNGSIIEGTNIYLNSLTLRYGFDDSSDPLLDKCLYGKEVTKTEIIDYSGHLYSYAEAVFDFNSFKLTINNEKITVWKKIDEEGEEYFECSLSRKTVGLIPIFISALIDEADKNKLFSFLKKYYLR